jgi:rubrerythrin
MKRTAINLMNAFIHEAQARTRYELFARVARREEFLLIAKIFKEFSKQEKENAYWNFVMLQQLKKEENVESIKIEIESPTTYGSTAENLESAIREEEEEGFQLYPRLADIANDEGYTDIAIRLREVAKTEKNHLYRFKTLLKLIQEGAFFNNKQITVWKCMGCGYEEISDKLEEDFKCPICGHLKSYFQKEVFDLVNQNLITKEKEKSIWICMECGFEVVLQKLPDNWKCPSCKKPKEYFKRKPTFPKKSTKLDSKREKATWVCLQCGNEEKVDLPSNWKCSICGYPLKE